MVENILFYQQPLTAIFGIGAFFLHRFASSGRLMDASIFFWSLMLISGMRSLFNLFWFILLGALLFYAIPKWRRTTLLSLSLTLVLLCFIYGNHFILFGGWVPGSDVYGATNFARMATSHIPASRLQALVDQGKINKAVISSEVYDIQNSPLMRLVPTPPKRGIPILDDRFKSTGAVNWNSLWMT